ncbi:Uncharacterized protein Adt_08571 [Abeliophyllum distichum]|uniref:Uncharacterized protein n=1 Tax=Abeliophyllum distichum TaxID=126358 RepID=A0ABD1UEU0_9LAMI
MNQFFYSIHYTKCGSLIIFFSLISIKKSDGHGSNEQKATTIVDIISHVDKPNFGENDFSSFDLRIDVTPKFIYVDVDDEFFSNEEVQRQLEEAFVTISESTDPNECNRTGTIPVVSVEITPTAPLKRISKPGRCLLSSYLPNDGSSPSSASKLSDDIIVFKEKLALPDDSDIFTFDDWFNKGYKPHNKYKSLYFNLCNRIKLIQIYTSFVICVYEEVQ